MKNYIKFLLKKYLPIYVVFVAICVSMFLVSLTGENNAYYRPEGVEYYVTRPSSGLLLFIIPLAIMSTIAPIFANSYRYSLSSVDVHYQVGQKEKTIRIVNNLTLLVAIFATYSIAALLTLLLMFFKQLPNAGKIITFSGGGGTKEYILFNFGYYILAYLCGVIVCAINYFISYLFISRANNALNSLICLFIGQALLSTLFMTPFWYVEAIGSLFNYYISFINTNILPGTQTSSIIAPIALISNVFEPLIVGNNVEIIMTSDDIFSLILSIVSLILFFAFGGFSIFAFLKEKETSGELAGKPEGRDKWQMIMFHSAAGLIAFWQVLANGLVSTIIYLNIIATVSTFIMFVIFYYLFYGLIRRNFKLKKKDFAILLPISSIYIISVILFNIFKTIAVL